MNKKLDIPCEYLTWDSEFFGIPIGMIAASTVTDETIGMVIEWCRQQGIVCCYFLAEPTVYESIRIAGSNGFDFIDIRMTLEYAFRRSVRISPLPPVASLNIRDYRSEDLPILQRYAVENHVDSRFSRDPRFSDTHYRRLYYRWMERECEDADTRVFVATVGSAIAGYITCKITGGGKGSIGLSGVNRDARNCGIGTALMEKAVGYFGDENCGSITVVTQGGNINALRLYTSNGFYPVDVKLWYHKWFTVPDECK